MAKSSKIDKGIQIVVKNPDISHSDLAEKIGYPRNSGWRVRQTIDKKMAKAGISAGSAIPNAKVPKIPARKDADEFLPLISTDEKDYITIKIPRNMLAKQLVGDILRGMQL